MGLALTVVTLTVPTTPAKVMRAAALATITMNKAIYPSNSSQIYTSECMPMSPCCHWLHRAPAGVGPFPEKFLSLLAGCCRYQDAGIENVPRSFIGKRCWVLTQEACETLLNRH